MKIEMNNNAAFVTIIIGFFITLIIFMAITKCSGQQSQTIQLNKGWQIISSNIIPDTIDIEYIFRNVDVDVMVSFGGVWWKDHEMNSIVNWEPNKAYKIKMKSAGSVTLIGEQIVSPVEVNLAYGTNLMPVPSTYPVNIQELFTGYINDIFIIVDLETTQFFCPTLETSNLEYLIPGRGYIVVMFNPMTIIF